jgi:hypothetical protein
MPVRIRVCQVHNSPIEATSDMTHKTFAGFREVRRETGKNHAVPQGLAIHPAGSSLPPPRGPVKQGRDCQQPARLRRILPPLREPPKPPARVVRPHRNSLAHWQTTLRLPP